MIAVRDAEERDLPAIVALYADDELGATREDPGEPLAAGYLRAFAAISADPRTRLVVVESEGAVVATVQLTFLPHLVRRGGERAQLEAVRVASSHRGSGLGRELVGWAVEQARARGCVLVQLTTDVTRARRPPVLRVARLPGRPRRHEARPGLSSPPRRRGVSSAGRASRRPGAAAGRGRSGPAPPGRAPPAPAPAPSG
ncbi:GNAT family N-acetyltransferase [Modestobacter versicolor]|uniref:GNAT family N-acetyltransferase n=1 Tax=Modestobacter versicolor TaxID=429133 RepID=UPI0034DE8893